MSNPRAATECGPVGGFVRPCLSFRNSISSSHTDNLSYFDNLELTFLMQVVLSANSSRLLPLQLGFEHFSTLA